MAEKLVFRPIRQIGWKNDERLRRLLVHPAAVFLLPVPGFISFGLLMPNARTDVLRLIAIGLVFSAIATVAPYLLCRITRKGAAVIERQLPRLALVVTDGFVALEETESQNSGLISALAVRGITKGWGLFGRRPRSVDLPAISSVRLVRCSDGTPWNIRIETLTGDTLTVLGIFDLCSVWESLRQALGESVRFEELRSGTGLFERLNFMRLLLVSALAGALCAGGAHLWRLCSDALLGLR